MSFCSSTKKSVSFVVYLVRILAHLFFTAAHFHLALVVASISYFLTAATKLSCPQIWNIHQEKDKEKEKAGARPAKLNRKKGDRDLEQEIKNKGDIFLLEE